MGYPVISLTGWQAGMRHQLPCLWQRPHQAGGYGADAETELDQKNTIVIVTGFQGINKL